MRWSSTEMTGTRTGRGSGSGSSVLPTGAESSVARSRRPGEADGGTARGGSRDGGARDGGAAWTGAGGAAVIDLVVRGGTLVDGTGGPARRADVGVDGGRIVAVGDVDDGARRVIDAEGAVVAPGFVDLHTHYDAQLFWDPTASPSPLHGVTTVFGGNCGFSLAPAGPEHAEYLTRMLARVEGMPLAALQAGIDWSWDSFGEWLGRLDGSVGVNAGFLVGHSTLRRAVIGEDAVGAPASEDQLARMEAGLHRALSEGAMGLSSSTAHTHNDGDGQPVPSRAAGPGELERLATVLGGHAGTTVELIVPGCLNGFTDEEMALLTRVSLAAGRPVNWNVLAATAANPEGTAHQLEASDRVARAGARVVALTLPHTMALRLSFEHGAILEGLPGWRTFFAAPVDERIAVLSDPAARRAMDDRAQSDEAGILRFLADWVAWSSPRPSPPTTPASRVVPWGTWPPGGDWARGTPCAR